MSFWPIIVGIAILAIAVILYHLLPAIIDFEMSFLWVIGIFLVFYVGAAVYLSYSIPAIGKTLTPSQQQAQNADPAKSTEISVEDRIVKE